MTNTTEPTSPFVPGARVARSTRFRDGYTEAFVEKVHKSGRFTLVGGRGQQWRPYTYNSSVKGEVTWHATQTGDGWMKDSVRPWDETTDAAIRAEMANASRKERAQNLRRRFESVRPDAFTDEMLDAIEAVLP